MSVSFCHGHLEVLVYKAFQVSVHHGLDVARLVARAVILDHGVGAEDIAADLTAPLYLFEFAGDGSRLFLAFALAPLI